MEVTYTVEDLQNFEKEICNCFNNRMIRAPVHIDNGNEAALIELFTKHVNKEDWVCGTWRQHFKALLKGVPAETVKQAILQGRSIGLCFKDYKVISSAIVGGIFPIALGLAWSIKRKGDTNKVVCFAGDMSFETGIAHECIKYANNFQLPILFVLEDNGKSVCTPTLDTWGLKQLTYGPHIEVKASSVPNFNSQDSLLKTSPNKIIYYKYQSTYPHAGCGQRIQF